MTSEKLLRRTASSQDRPQLPKRSSSVRRAWKNIFGSHPPTSTSPEHSPVKPPGSAASVDVNTKPESPTSPSAEAPAEERRPRSRKGDQPRPSVDVAQPRPSVQTTRSHGSIGTERRENPGKTKATEVELLRQELDQCQYELGEARAIVYSQEDELAILERGQEKLRGEFEKEYKQKEEALARHKTAVEERMVAAVVQQINDARQREREAVKAKYEDEHRGAVDALQKKYEKRIAALNAEFQAFRTSSDQLQAEHTTQIETLKSQLSTKESDLLSMRTVASEGSDKLTSVQEDLTKALEEAQAHRLSSVGLEAKIAAITTDLNEANAKLEASEDTIKEHTDRFAELQSSSTKLLDDAAASFATLKSQSESQIAALTAEVESRSVAITELEGKHASALAAVTAAQETHQSLHEAQSTAQKEIRSLKEALEAAEAGHIAARDQIETLRKAESSLEESKVHVADLEERLNPLESELQASEAAKESLKAQLAEADAEKERLSVELASALKAEELVGELEKQVAGLRSTNEELTAQKAGFETDKAKLVAKLGDAEAAKKTAEEQLSALEEADSTLSAEYDVVNDTLKGVEERLALSEAARFEAENKFEEVEAARNKTEEDFTAIQNANAELSSRIAVAETAKSDAEDQLQKIQDELKSSYADLEEQLTNANQARDSAQELLAKAHEDHRNATAEATSNFEAELGALKDKHAAVKQRVQDLVTQIQSLEAEHQTAREQHERDVDALKDATIAEKDELRNIISEKEMQLQKALMIGVGTEAVAPGANIEEEILGEKSGVMEEEAKSTPVKEAASPIEGNAHDEKDTPVAESMPAETSSASDGDVSTQEETLMEPAPTGDSIEEGRKDVEEIHDEATSKMSDQESGAAEKEVVASSTEIPGKAAHDERESIVGDAPGLDVQQPPAKIAPAEQPDDTGTVFADAVEDQESGLPSEVTEDETTAENLDGAAAQASDLESAPKKADCDKPQSNAEADGLAIAEDNSINEPSAVSDSNDLDEEPKEHDESEHDMSTAKASSEQLPSIEGAPEPGSEPASELSMGDRDSSSPQTGSTAEATPSAEPALESSTS